MKMTNGALIVRRMLLLDKQQSTDKVKVLVRVIYIDDSNSTIWLCRIDDDSWPFRLSRSELDAAMDSEHGHYAVEFNDPWTTHSTNKQKQRTINLHKQRVDFIQPLIEEDNERLILYKEQRKNLIRNRLKEVTCSYQTMADLLKLYWKRGMTYDALAPDFNKCGILKNKEATRTVSKKLGARRRITPGVGINTDSEHVRKALQSGASYWLSKKIISLKDAWDQMTRIYFSRPVKDDNKRIISYEVEPDKKPTITQLDYYIKKHYLEGKIRRRRHGQKNWVLHERPLLGSADGDVQGTADRFQIDATVADVYLVSQFDRRRIVGRPVIYFIIDVFSRMIVGIYVGFEGPSWPGAMMALTNMVMPKVEYCRQYDIEIEEADWPSHHAPKKIMGDRGELMSDDSGKNIVEKLLIQIENASPGRADLKALVERRFGIVPAKFRAFTPGYINKDFDPRVDEDYRLKATLNLFEFTQLVILSVLEHNAEPIKGMKLPAEMVTEGLTACPLDLWEWGIDNRSGKLTMFTVDDLRRCVMPPSKGTVTAKGILFKGGYYSSQTAISKEWFAKARRQPWEVKVSYDPRNLGIVYLPDVPVEGGFEPCKLLSHNSDRDGKSLIEVNELDIDRNQTQAKGENERQEKRILKDKQMQEIKLKAQKAKKAVEDPDASKASKLAHIKENKAAEKQQHRSVETFNMSDTPMSDANNSLPDASKNVIDLNEYGKNELAKLAAKRKLREKK